MAGAHTIVEALERVSSCRESGFTHMRANGEVHFESFSELYRRANRIGRALQLRGFSKGDRLGLILSDSQQFADSLFGAFLIAAVPVPLSPPSAHVVEPASHLRHVEPAILKARPRLVLCDPDLRSLPIGAVSVVTFDELLEETGAEDSCARVDVQPGDTALLQFTSGSTSQPKGVRLNHANLVANVAAMAGAHCFRCTPQDYCVSWLPLHHDMGLVAKMLMPVYAGMRGGLFMPSAVFLEDPISWLRQISTLRGTIVFAPNFAFSLCVVRANDNSMHGVDLSSLRVAACAAEPIRCEVISAFAQKFAPYGLRPEALMPCYGLAEHTLGAAISPIGTGMTVDRIDANSLSKGFAVSAAQSAESEAHEARVVSCGRFLPGHEGRIVDSEGNTLPDRTLGEILLRGPSVMQDYFEDGEATAATLRDEWLHTGDLGYLADGNLYVCGRGKDVVIIYGRKYHPQDIEWEVEQVQGIRRGCVVAFGVEHSALHRDRVVIVAETRLSHEHHEQLKKSIRARIHRELTITPHVLLVPPHTVPQTSSGKLQRARARELFRSGSLTESLPKS